MACRFYGAALDSSMPDFHHAAGPFASAREAANAALLCCAAAAAVAEDVPIAPALHGAQGDTFVLQVRGLGELNFIVGPYRRGDGAAAARLRAEAPRLLSDGAPPLILGVLRFVYTFASGMQAAVIEAY